MAPRRPWPPLPRAASGDERLPTESNTLFLARHIHGELDGTVQPGLEPVLQHGTPVSRGGQLCHTSPMSSPFCHYNVAKNPSACWKVRILKVHLLPPRAGICSTLMLSAGCWQQATIRTDCWIPVLLFLPPLWLAGEVTSFPSTSLERVSITSGHLELLDTTWVMLLLLLPNSISYSQNPSS